MTIRRRRRHAAPIGLGECDLCAANLGDNYPYPARAVMTAMTILGYAADLCVRHAAAYATETT